MGHKEVSIVQVHGSAFHHQGGTPRTERVGHRDAYYAAAGGVGGQSRNLTELFFCFLLVIAECGHREGESDQGNREERKSSRHCMPPAFLTEIPGAGVCRTCPDKSCQCGLV